MSIDELLAEREQTHGSFKVNARVAQTIRYAIREASGWAALPIPQKEALDHIAGKIGRIVAGGRPCPDHFCDIAGYARLGEMDAISQLERLNANPHKETSAAHDR